MDIDCTTHRPPEGPNEDLSVCPRCRRMTYSMRPPDETYGRHLSDCSLPRHHEGHCVGGGDGHPPAPKIRGYWP